MDTRVLLTEHWEELLNLRAEYLGYALSTSPADREKLEHAIANIYRLAELEPPRQVLWFNSQIDARICVALWIWMLDPYVHSHNTFMSTDARTESKFMSSLRRQAEIDNEELKLEFPTLFSTSDKPELLLSEQFAEVLRPQADTERSSGELLSVLSTSVKVVSTNPVRILIPDCHGITMISQLMAFIKDPEAAAESSLRQGLEGKVIDRQVGGGVEQELFGPAVLMRLREHMIYPINRQLTEIIENGVIEKLLGPWDTVKQSLQVYRKSWDPIGMRLSSISAADNQEFRSCLARNARRLSALNSARSPMADALSAALHRALEILGVNIVQTQHPLVDAVTAGGWWWPFKDVCFACDNPAEIHVTDHLRLHNENDMAMRFRDGWGFWALDDVQVPEEVVKNQYSAADIDAVSDRRFLLREVMIRRFGLSKYLRESGSTEIHRDDYGILYRKTLPDGTLIGIVLANETADHGFNSYSLCVPPEITTANEAVAWTLSRSAIVNSLSPTAWKQ